MIDKKIRVAVIGTGGIGEGVHIPAYLSNRNVSLVALVDVDKKKAEKAAKKYKVPRIFSCFDELLENIEVDALSVCTPPDNHTEIVLKAFDHDVHVFCEKPLAIDVESGKKMVRASKIKNKVLMVGFHRRFIYHYQMARRLIQSGDLGNVYAVEDHYLGPNPLYGWSKSPWFFRRGVGGVLLDSVPHVIDTLNFLIGDYPRKVTANSSTYFDSPVEDFCSFLLEYPGQKVGIGVASWLSPTVTENISIYGTGQNLYVSPNFVLKSSPNDIREISLWRSAFDSLVTLKFPNLSFLRTRRVYPYQREIDCFVEKIRRNKGFSTTALDALSVLITCDAAREAIEKNKVSEIPPIEGLVP